MYVRSVAALGSALCLLLLSLASGQAQTPNANPPGKLTFQGFLTDGSGIPLGSASPINTNVVFKIYNVLSGGGNANVVWAESQNVTVDNGHFSVLLGEGQAVSPYPNSADLTSVFTGATASDRYLELQVGSSGPVVAPRLQFLPAPYAFLSRNANNLVNAAGQSILSYDNVAGISQLSGNQHITGNLTVDGQASLGTGLFVISSAHSVGNYPTAQGTYIEWNVSGGTGETSFLNQRGFGSGGFVFGESTDKTHFTRTFSIDGSGNATVPGTLTVGSVSVANTLTATTFSGNGTIPIGGIIMWSGNTGNIPAGWGLCDGGTHDGQKTPDLRDRFIVGAGNSYGSGGQTGGATQVALATGNLPPHNHWYYDTYWSEHFGGGPFGYFGSNGQEDQDNNPFYFQSYRLTVSDYRDGFNSTPFSIIPPYYALAFIMRTK